MYDHDAFLAGLPSSAAACGPGPEDWVFDPIGLRFVQGPQGDDKFYWWDTKNPARFHWSFLPNRHPAIVAMAAQQPPTPTAPTPPVAVPKAMPAAVAVPKALPLTVAVHKAMPVTPLVPPHPGPPSAAAAGQAQAETAPHCQVPNPLGQAVVKENHGRLGPAGQWAEADRTVFIGNMPWWVERNTLDVIFRAVGVPVDNISMHKPSWGSGMRSAKVVVRNPATNLRRLVMELHGHLR